MTDARIPDHCGWAARGRWREAYDAAEAALRKVTAERDTAIGNLFIMRVERNDAEGHEAETANELRTVRARTEAEVSALRAELDAARGRVKPLVWREVNDGNRRKGEVFGTRSPVSFAPITAHKKHDGWWLSADCKTYPTLEAAKSAAQADYTARILAALEPDPAMARMREALRPFSIMAGAMFARNWNKDGVAISFVTENGPVRLTFADFLAARTALKEE